MTLPALRPLAFGEVLDQSFGLFRQSFVPLVIISFVCSGIPTLLSVAVEARGGALEAPWLWGAAMIFSVIGGSLASGASTYVVSERYLGNGLEAGEALARMWPRIWTILWTSISVSFITGLGIILLIIPGIIAFCGLALAVTAVVVEGVDADTGRSRSWELTKGFKGRVLGLFWVYALIAGIAIGGFGMVAGVLAAIGTGDVANEMGKGGTLVLVTTAVGSLVSLVVTPLLYCILIVTYYDLRVRKEAFDLDLLASTLEQVAVPRTR